MPAKYRYYKHLNSLDALGSTVKSYQIESTLLYNNPPLYFSIVFISLLSSMLFTFPLQTYHINCYSDSEPLELESESESEKETESFEPSQSFINISVDDSQNHQK